MHIYSSCSHLNIEVLLYDLVSEGGWHCPCDPGHWRPPGGSAGQGHLLVLDSCHDDAILSLGILILCVNDHCLD